MDYSDLSWEDCLPVLEAEARRYESMGAQIGLGRDDLIQEASIAAVQCLRLWRPEGGGRAAYVRRAVRNRFADVRRKALREKRMPHDGQGRLQPQWLVSYESLLEDNGLLPCASGDSRVVEARSLLRRLCMQLPPDDWEFLVSTLVRGAHLARDLAPGQRKRIYARLRLVRADARRILNQVLRVEEKIMSPLVTKPQPIELPECHAKGEQPQGYDREDHTCWNCPDKFTCLPTALESNLIVGAVTDDREVEAVLACSMTSRTAFDRMRTRLMILKRGGAIPEELLVHTQLAAARSRGAEVITPVEVPESSPSKPQITSQPAKAVVTKKAVKKAPKKAVKKAPKKAVKKAVKKAPKKAVKKRKKTAPKKVATKKPAGVRRRRRRGAMKNGKPLPPVRANTREQQHAALDRVKIGQPFDLNTGMQLVRKTKDGEHIIVKIKPLGFELDGVTYSSLSTAIMYKLRKMTSGNAYFHLEHNQCTEVWSSTGKVLAGHSSQ